MVWGVNRSELRSKAPLTIGITTARPLRTTAANSGASRSAWLDFIAYWLEPVTQTIVWKGGVPRFGRNTWAMIVSLPYTAGNVTVSIRQSGCVSRTVGALATTGVR